MGWLEALRGKVVGLDTAPVIYYIEKHKSYIGLMHPFFEAVDRGDCSAVTSIVTLLEGLVIPIRNGDVELVRRYHEFLLDTKGLTTSTLFTNIVEGAARL